MPRMNVYVPDDLYNTMPEGRRVNWSEVFQDAVRQVISGKQPEDQPDLDALIDVESLQVRLQGERQAIYRKGYEIGVKWAQQLSYADYRFCESVKWDVDKVFRQLAVKGLDSDLEDAATSYRPDVGDYFDHRYGINPFDEADTSTEIGARLVLKEAVVDALRRAWRLANGDSASLKNGKVQTAMDMSEAIRLRNQSEG